MKVHFLPYVQECFKACLPLIKFRYLDEVRANAATAMPALLGVMAHAVADPASGVPAGSERQLLEAFLMPLCTQVILIRSVSDPYPMLTCSILISFCTTASYISGSDKDRIRIG